MLCLYTFDRDARRARNQPTEKIWDPVGIVNKAFRTQHQPQFYYIELLEGRLNLHVAQSVSACLF